MLFRSPAVPKLPTLALPVTVNIPAVPILPMLALPLTLTLVNVPTAVTCVCEALTLIVVPVIEIPVPAS